MIALVLTCALLTPLVPQGEEMLVTASDVDVAFAVLDRFDDVDTSKLPFIKVATGRSVADFEGRRQNTYRHGFLVHADGKHFRVRYVDWETAVLVNTPVGTAEQERVGFAPADLREFAAATAAALGARHDRADGFRRSPGTPWRPTSFALLVMRACARGEHWREGRLLEEAVLDAAPAVRDGSRSLASLLEIDLEQHLIREFADPSRSWRDLLDHHEAWLEAYPRDDRVEARRQGLLAAIADAKARAGGASTERMNAAVRDLADAFLHVEAGFWDTMAMSLYSLPPDRGVGPIDRVSAFGLQVVPRLIATLDDPSLTRSVCSSSRFGGILSVRTLGELADQALQELAGFDACERDPKRDWHDWFERATRDGVRKCLADAMCDCDRGSEAARSYLRRWPDDLDTVIDATRARPCRSTLLDVLVGSAPHARDARIVRLLEEQIGVGSEAQRIETARRLLAWDNPSGVMFLWQETRGRLPASSQLLSLLLESGLAECWQSLLAPMDGATRAGLIRVLQTTTIAELLAHVPNQERERRLALLRRCLLEILQDDTPCGEQVVLGHGQKRVCIHRLSRADVAAWVLAANWSDEFQFDGARTSSARRAQIAAMRQASTAAPVAKRLPEGQPHRAPQAARAVEFANTVRTVQLDSSAAALPAALQARIRLMGQRELDSRTLLEILIATAGADASEGKFAVLDVERTVPGDGTSITCSLLPAGAEFAEASYRLTATAGGREVEATGRRDAWATLRRIDDGARDFRLSAIDRALSTPAMTSLEVRLKLQRR
jgi:hypothetical protein